MLYDASASARVIHNTDNHNIVYNEQATVKAYKSNANCDFGSVFPLRWKTGRNLVIITSCITIIIHGSTNGRNIKKTIVANTRSSEDLQDMLNLHITEWHLSERLQLLMGEATQTYANWCTL